MAPQEDEEDGQVEMQEVVAIEDAVAVMATLWQHSRIKRHAGRAGPYER